MISKDRQYRNFEVRASEEGMIVEGYAVTFNQAETMYEYDGIEYKEEIDKKAFAGAEMNDVVMNYNHDGKPFARTKNGTLNLTTDDFGLKIRADLSGTEEGRKTYEEVKGGYLDKMSFAFSVNKEEYDQQSRLRRITGIKRLFDVAIVDIPAYNTTSVSARSFFEQQKELETKEEKDMKRRKLLIKIRLNSMK
jgi:uncharacterized protein